MASNWLLVFLFFVYPLIVIGFNNVIRCCIPCRKTRKRFLQKNDYMSRLMYLLVPLLVLHLELMLIKTDYPFEEMNVWVIVILVGLQGYLFIAGVLYFLDFFGALNKFKKRFQE